MGDRIGEGTYSFYNLVPNRSEERRVGKTDRFQKALEHAILAAFSMKTEKGNVEGLLNERFQMILLRRIQLLDNKPCLLYTSRCV